MSSIVRVKYEDVEHVNNPYKKEPPVPIEVTSSNSGDLLLDTAVVTSQQSPPQQPPPPPNVVGGTSVADNKSLGQGPSHSERFSVNPTLEGGNNSQAVSYDNEPSAVDQSQRSGGLPSNDPFVVHHENLIPLAAAQGARVKFPVGSVVIWTYFSSSERPNVVVGEVVAVYLDFESRDIVYELNTGDLAPETSLVFGKGVPVWALLPTAQDYVAGVVVYAIQPRNADVSYSIQELESKAIHHFLPPASIKFRQENVVSLVASASQANSNNNVPSALGSYRQDIATRPAGSSFPISNDAISKPRTSGNAATRNFSGEQVETAPQSRLGSSSSNARESNFSREHDGSARARLGPFNTDPGGWSQNPPLSASLPGASFHQRQEGLKPQAQSSQIGFIPSSQMRDVGNPVARSRMLPEAQMGPQQPQSFRGTTERHIDLEPQQRKDRTEQDDFDPTGNFECRPGSRFFRELQEVLRDSDSETGADYSTTGVAESQVIDSRSQEEFDKNREKKKFLLWKTSLEQSNLGKRAHTSEHSIDSSSLQSDQPAKKQKPVEKKRANLLVLPKWVPVAPVKALLCGESKAALEKACRCEILLRGRAVERFCKKPLRMYVRINGEENAIEPAVERIQGLLATCMDSLDEKKLFLHDLAIDNAYYFRHNDCIMYQQEPAECPSQTANFRWKWMCAVEFPASNVNLVVGEKRLGLRAIKGPSGCIVNTITTIHKNVIYISGLSFKSVVQCKERAVARIEQAASMNNA